LVRLRDSGLTHFLHLETILAVQLRVLNSPDLSDGNAAVAQPGGVVAGADELRLERANDKVLDVAVSL